MKEVELFPDDPKSAECIKQLEQEIKLLSNLQHPNIVHYFGSEIVHDRFFIYLEYVHPGANLLVDASGVVKLADFGMAKHLTGQRADLSLKGSPFWMAPELMQAVMQRDSNPDLAFAVDIWSLGCTIIEIFTGKPPWSEFEGAAVRDSPPVPETIPTASMLLEHRFLNNSSVLSTSPRNSDEPNSRRGKPNFKLDQVPRARNVTSSESESWQQQHRSPDVIGTVTRLSRRSTLEAIRSPSPSQQPKASTDRRRIGVSSDHI
ncbi:hypothetical protein BRARA_B03981 [Brassica rapa]|uniref:Protein kinase domain-containing protein n=1 Tax=Brassica campestris TaxID=3711 RepID=A0A398AGX1_BRACM|nr:hypothetical protein BRARA_B03981 [Brassica rapa]